MNFNQGLLLAWLIFLVSCGGLFLSLWVWLPAPTFSLLPLSVGAPEISPWLVLGHAIALLLALLSRATLPGRLALALSAAALVLSSWPLVQLPSVVRQADQQMVEQLGQGVMVQRPAAGIDYGTSRPFSLKAAFRGLDANPSHSSLTVPFAAPQGVPLTLMIYRPKEAGPHPTVLTVYGGAWRRGSPQDNAEFHRYLAGQGYTVIALDYRHAPAHPFPAQLEDVRAALAFIQARAEAYGVDLTRVAVLGRSAGAHLAMLLAYGETPFPLRGVVNFYGPISLAAAYRDPPRPDPIDTRAVLDDLLGGSPSELPEPYRLASPIEQVRPGLPPTLTLQGGRDHIVEAKYARQLTERLWAAGNPALLIELPWADHAFDAVFNGPSNQLSLYYVERFLADVLR